LIGVRQQYPPVFGTPDLRQSATRKRCNKTYFKNQCTVGWSCGSFWTEASKTHGWQRPLLLLRKPTQAPAFAA